MRESGLRSVFGLLFLLVLWNPARPCSIWAKESAADRPLRIIAFGAHPDDVEFQLAGTALQWARLGHKVKFVSVTNGDIGHWQMAGEPYAKRRTAEVQEAAKRLGIEVEVLDIHDGEIMPTLENRKTIARLIREWQADLVFCHRPEDYHPDHRNCGLIVRDAAFMVTVPFYVPDTPRIEHNTVFMYFYDRFTKPYVFQGDVAVSIDDVLDDKVHALDALESQVYDGGALGSEKVMEEKAAADPVARKKLLYELWSKRHQTITDKYRDTVIEWYGQERGQQIKHAEIFEICEYGYQPTKEELRRLFPFYDEPAK